MTPTASSCPYRHRPCCGSEQTGHTSRPMRLSAWAPSIIAVVYIGRIWAVNQVPYDTNEHYTKFLPVASQLLGPMLPVPAHTVKQPPNETNALRPERTSNARDQPRSNMQRTTRSAQCTTCSEQLRPRRRRMRSARLQSPWASNRRPATACRRPSPACAHPCTILRYPIDSRAYVPFTPAAVSHLATAVRVRRRMRCGVRRHGPY